MNAREVIRRIKDLGGAEVRKGKGSHVRVACACGVYSSTVPAHKGEDVKRGTLGGIESDLEGCSKFGKGWLTR
jgi:predicted RNA binding protein YcfA (HicA-like mRNA interferase family)